jgi:hypothetical protein
MRRTLLPILVALLLLVACSSSSKTATSSNGTGGSNGASADPRTQQQLDADKATVEGANLKLSDFPTGWASTPNNESAANSKVQQELASCLHVDAALLDRAKVRSVSDDFNSHQATASATVVALPTVEQAQAVLAAQKKPEARDCYQKAFEAILRDTIAHPTEGASLPSGIKIEDVTVANLNVDPVGDDHVAYRVSVTVNQSGLTPKIYLDVISFIVGRYGVSLQTEDVLTPFDESQANELAKTIAGRLPAS